MKSREVLVHAFLHPANDCIVGNTVDVGQVVEVDLFEEFGDENATGRWNVIGVLQYLVSFSMLFLLSISSSDVTHLSSRAVVNSISIRRVRTNLPREISTLTLRVEDTIVDLLNNSNILSIDSAILGRCITTGGPGVYVSLAKVVAERGAVYSGTVIGFTDDGAQVEMEHTEIGTGENTVSTAIQWVAGGDGGVDDFVDGAGCGVVFLGLLDHCWVHM